MPRSRGSDNSTHGHASIGKTGSGRASDSNTGNGPNAKVSSSLMRIVVRAGGPEAKVNRPKPKNKPAQEREVPRHTPRVTGAQKRKARKNSGRYTSR